MLNSILRIIQNNYNLEQRDVKDYAQIQKRGMTFNINAYDVEGLGKISTINMKAFFGLMKMETLVLTPLEKDAPLFSFDFIEVLKNNTLLLELYDTQLKDINLDSLDIIKEKYSYLKDHDLGKHWYDHLKMSPTLSKRDKNKKNEYQKLAEEFLNEYINIVKSSDDVDYHEKQAKVKEYVDGLLTNGGPTVEQFNKLIGKEKTNELYEKYIFSSIG